MPKDPVCGKEVDKRKPGVLTVKFFDLDYYFHDLECLGKFEIDPYKYGKAPKK